ncbi:MAG TPA: AAA family ATPase [Chloroflexota bacterium]|nr:AAA family ATPase [Chloroflexota bacterium]
MSAPLGRPEFEQRGDTYRYLWRDAAIQVEFDRFTDKTDGIYTEILVAAVNEGGKPSLLHASRMNLLSPTARGNVARALAERGVKMNWGAALEQACFLAVQRYREGEPTVDLREVDPYERPRWLVKPYVEHGGPTVIFAQGGTGKSMFAAAIGITAASGKHLTGYLHGPPVPVLYLDWETDRWTHAERLNALCSGARIKEQPPIYYRRMVAPLPESVAVVRREVDRLKIGLVIYDSLGLACGGELESADTIIRTFGAIRSIQAPALIVSHVTKSTARGEGNNHRLSPFGSIYTENQARNTWSLHRSGDEGADESALALVHEKTNNGRFHKRHAYRMEFVSSGDGEDDALISVEIRHADLSEIADFESKLSLKDRIIAALRGGAMTPQAIGAQLGVESNQVRARITALRREGAITTLADQRIGLVARQSA